MPEIKCPNCGKIFSIDEKEYESIVKTIKDTEFEKTLNQRLALEEQKNKQNLELVKEQQKRESLEKEKNLEKQIETLKGQLNLKDSENELKIQKALNEKDREIDKLNNALLVQKNQEQVLLKQKEEEIRFYKDLKAKMSTKMVGETLEQHCLIEYNRVGRIAFPNATFEKDNDARNGSKGDFIFREKTSEGAELLSIMFEMKNENDETATKHKNEDFFKELDKDRNEKGCEFAVLVSMLEPDNELYNAGITDVSYEYPKMYVIRPQNFISIISLLRAGALNAAQYKNELMVIREQNLDITNFEKELDEFKSSVKYNADIVRNKYQEAIEDIDKAIRNLQKMRDALTSCDNNLRIANDKVQSITAKKLAKNSPSLKEQIKNK